MTSSSGQQQADQPLTTWGLLATLSTVLFWGANPVAVKYAMDWLPPLMVAALRFSLAAVFMLFWCKWGGCGILPRRGQWKPIVITGLLLFAQISLFHLGAERSSASHTILHICTYVFWVAGIEHWITRTHRLSGSKLLGLLVAASGVLLLLATQDNSAQSAGVDKVTPVGELCLLVSGFLLGVKVVYTKYAVSKVEPGKLILWHDIVGVILFLQATLLFEQSSLSGFTPAALCGLLYQGILVSGYCFAVQAHLLTVYAASRISVFSFLTPLGGVLLAVLLRGDPLTGWLFASGGCIACGIWLVNRKG